MLRRGSFLRSLLLLCAACYCFGSLLLLGLSGLRGGLRGGCLCGGAVLDPPFDFIDEHRDGQDSVKDEGRDEHPFVLWMVFDKKTVAADTPVA